MRSETERAEQSVAIGSALFLFAALVAVVGLLVWALHAWTTVGDDELTTCFEAGVLVAAVVAVVQLAREEWRR